MGTWTGGERAGKGFLGDKSSAVDDAILGILGLMFRGRRESGCNSLILER